MSDPYHTCVWCEIADKNVVDNNIPHVDGTRRYAHHSNTGETSAECIRALKRQLAAANALIGRCRPYVDGSIYGFLGKQSRALLADIDAAMEAEHGK